ncbi:response regulator [bacterium]|nr:response regulator [bacterium]MBU1651476.1 response regulator [bacterium]MBU1880499.1 response regulator [bacterium]
MNKETKKILVVDDEQDVRSYLKAALQDAGFQVTTAVDGFDALEKVQAELPDLISLDLVMPRHSGAMFHRGLRKNKRWAKIPVLIVTGHAQDDLGKSDFEELIMYGPGVYLEKPVSPAAYVKAVCKLLGVALPEGVEKSANDLRDELESKLKNADPDALQRALEALKKNR